MSEVKTNKISSLASNNDITLDPDGTGRVAVTGSATMTGTDTFNSNATGSGILLKDSGVTSRQLHIAAPGSVSESVIGTPNSHNLTFATNNTERMRIDTSGNLMVAGTAAEPRNASSGGQVLIGDDGRVEILRSSNLPLVVNRGTDNGEIINLRKSGTTVARIGNGNGGGADGIDIDGNAGYVGINTGDANAGGWQFFSRAYTSVPRLRPATDNFNDLGESAKRIDDIFASNGTIQTSDQNEKQQIASLTTAEMTAAKAISKLFKTFKWNDNVAVKGDAARRHAGVIAQEVQTAMTDAGLDAAHYAFWCSNTWWETSTDVPAVEADEEAGIEAQDAYTRIDTYYTADEAPEGATQRTRLGIRYPELLAFIGAATEQRLADLETRVTALENA